MMTLRRRPFNLRTRQSPRVFFAGMHIVIDLNEASLRAARLPYQSFVLCGESMHRAPTPTPDHEPYEERDPEPTPIVPSPDDDPVPDHNPTCA
jgi:hypothetical protein